MRRLGLALLCALAAAGPASAQTVSGAVYEGGAPAKDAFVIVHWTGNRPGFVHFQTVCIQAAVARTDERGRFEIREPPPLRSTFLVWRYEPAIAVWKPSSVPHTRWSSPGYSSKR